MFDVFGTLVDWHSSIAAHAARVGARAGVDLDGPRLAKLWRERYQPSMDVVRSGARPWTNLDELQAESLREVLAELGVELGEADQAELVAGWHRLDPWPEVPAALARLRERVPVATLSNGHFRLLLDLAKYADLRFDAIISAELADSFKPDPAVYRMAARLLDVPVEGLMLAACHPSDLAAAGRVGLRTGYIARPAEWGAGSPPTPAPDTDLVADDLADLVDQLLGA